MNYLQIFTVAQWFQSKRQQPVRQEVAVGDAELTGEGEEITGESEEVTGEDGIVGIEVMVEIQGWDGMEEMVKMEMFGEKEIRKKVLWVAFVRRNRLLLKILIKKIILQDCFFLPMSHTCHTSYVDIIIAGKFVTWIQTLTLFILIQEGRTGS